MDVLCVVVYVPEEVVPPINLLAALAGQVLHQWI